MRRPTALLLLCLVACATSGVTPLPPPAWPPAPPAYQPPDGWWRDAVFYEVFVRSFKDSDGDGKGDLKGLIQKLDYLNDGDPATTSDLGVDALWLMPIFKSPSYHGYDTTDYEALAADYGTPEDFRTLIVEAHRRGIKVVVDLVLNHTSSFHPWFQAASAGGSARRDWYVWSATDPGWTQPFPPAGPTWHPLGGAYYYGVFWSGMPDLNWKNPAVAAEADRLARLWLDRGVDGFRLDAVRHLVEEGPGAKQADQPATHAALKAFAAGVRAHKPGATLVGEAWSDTLTISDYYGDTAAVPGGDELPLLFDFPLAAQIATGVAGGNADGIDFVLRDVLATYPPGATDAPFLTNHDQVRFATAVGGGADKLKLGAAILLTLPGAPFLYYGEEVGLANRPDGNDESKRTPMPWDATPGRGFTTGSPWYAFSDGPADANVAAQAGDPGSLLSRYRALIRLRQGSAALRRGALGPLTSGHPGLLAFTRTLGGETVLVVHNLSGAPATSAALPVAGAAATALFPAGGATLSGATGAWIASLPARASGVWRLQ